MLAATYVCQANYVAVSAPNLIWTTHLDFQETYSGYPKGCIQPFSGIYLNSPQSQADPCYQVHLPGPHCSRSAGRHLHRKRSQLGCSARLALQAYAATDNSQWGVNGSNWCCVNARVGCPPPVNPVTTRPRPAKLSYPVARCAGCTGRRLRLAGSLLWQHAGRLAWQAAVVPACSSGRMQVSRQSGGAGNTPVPGHEHRCHQRGALVMHADRPCIAAGYGR